MEKRPLNGCLSFVLFGALFSVQLHLLTCLLVKRLEKGEVYPLETKLMKWLQKCRRWLCQWGELEHQMWWRSVHTACGKWVKYHVLWLVFECCIFLLNFVLLVTFLLNSDDTPSRLYETHLGADCGQIEAMITQNWQLDFNRRRTFVVARQCARSQWRNAEPVKALCSICSHIFLSICSKRELTRPSVCRLSVCRL